MLSDVLIQRFWDKVQILGPNECWLWSATTSKGYGLIKIPKTRKSVRANRLSLMIKEGVWNPDPDKIACHTCDNPRCVNPSHLFWGTHKINSDDKISKGRFKTGDQRAAKNGNAKLSEVGARRVVDLIKLGLNNKEIADELCITHQAVSLIRLGKTWKSIFHGEKFTEKYQSIMKGN